MRYLIAAALLAATVALAFSGCARSTRSQDSRHAAQMLEDKALACVSGALSDAKITKENRILLIRWCAETYFDYAGKIAALSSADQARILREARSVERLP